MHPLKLARTNDSIVELFKNSYRNMMIMDISALDKLYTDDLVFKDPVHQIEGLATMQDYLSAMMARVQECRFEFLDQMESSSRAYVKWNMHFRHPSLANGDVITVRGISQIQFDEKIYYHEDVYDLGEMLYEHIPLLGLVNRGIKKRLGAR